MEELVDTVVTSVQKEKGTATVVLKLEGCWLNVTLKHFQQLVEEIFLKKSQCLHLVRVEQGCVSIQWTVSECVVSSLVSLTNQRTEFMKYVGIIRLTIDDVVVFKQESKDITSLSSLLIKAIECCSVDVVCFLLSIGIEPNIKDDKGYSILLYSSILAHDLSNGDKYYTIIDALLNAGADPNVTNNKGYTPLLYAVMYQCPRIVKLLLDHKADPNIHPDHDYSPLLISTEQNYCDIVSYLLNTGANPDVLDSEGYTPVMIACYFGHKAVVSILLQHKVNPNTQKKDGWTGLMMACQFNRSDIVEIFIDAEANVDVADEDGWTALMVACNHPKNVDIVQCLLKAGADPNHQIPSNGWTAIHFACNGLPDPAILLSLIDAGGNPEISTANGLTPLVIACKKGFEIIVEILLNLNVSVNIQTQAGVTALMVAALYSNSINIVQSLLSAGADIHLTDSINYTALDYALMSNNPEIAQLLLQQVFLLHVNVGDNNTEYRQPIESEKQIQQLSLDEHLYEDFEASSH